MMTHVEQVERLHKGLPPPTPDVIRFLRGKGVSIDALVEPELPALAPVVFRRRLFDFADEAADDGAVPALVFIARDEEGAPSDLVAWSAKTNRLAARYGFAALLGLDWDSRIESELRIFRDPVSWLRADRRGVVIVDRESARWELAGEPLIAADGDVSFGRRLRADLRLPEPQIFIEAAA